MENGPQKPTTEAFKLAFSVYESSEGTEEKPVIFYERNGFTFRADLDILESTAIVTLVTKRQESLDRDWQVLESEVQKQAQEELNKRRDDYSEYFA